MGFMMIGQSRNNRLPTDRSFAQGGSNSGHPADVHGHAVTEILA